MSSSDKNDTNDTNDTQTEVDADDMILLKMGYKQELRRGITAFGNFAFGFTEVAVLASFASVFGFGLTTGGESLFLHFTIRSLTVLFRRACNNVLGLPCHIYFDHDYFL